MISNIWPLGDLSHIDTLRTPILYRDNCRCRRECSSRFLWRWKGRNTRSMSLLLALFLGNYLFISCKLGTLDHVLEWNLGCLEQILGWQERNLDCCKDLVELEEVEELNEIMITCIVLRRRHVSLILWWWLNRERIVDMLISRLLVVEKWLIRDIRVWIILVIHSDKYILWYVELIINLIDLTYLNQNKNISQISQTTSWNSSLCITTHCTDQLLIFAWTDTERKET